MPKIISMMAATAAFTLFLSVVRADDIQVSSQLNSIPLFYTLSGENPMYGEATKRAQEAFFKQVGLSQNLDKAASVIGTNAKDRVATWIDRTPVRSRDLFFVVAAAYSVGVRHQFTQKFRSPFSSSITHTVTATKDSYATGLQLQF